MSNPHTRDRLTVAAVLTSLAVVLALVFMLPADGAGRSSSAETTRSAARAKPAVTLDAVGTKYVGAAFPMRGRTGGIEGWHKLLLQRYSSTHHRWYTLIKRYVRSGSYSFTWQRFGRRGVPAYRTVLYSSGRPAAYSRVIRVNVITKPSNSSTPTTPKPTPPTPTTPTPTTPTPTTPTPTTPTPPTCASNPSPTTCPQPDSFVQEQTVDQPYCPHLTVTTSHQTRTVNYTWDSSAKKWVAAPTAWVTDSSSERAASAQDCVHILGSVPSNAALPDLQIRDLTKCTQVDLDDTNGTCFKIVPSAPYNASYPALEGKKLLKFAVITLNMGDGPSEIIADRSAADADDWSAYQSFYDMQGKLLGSVVDPNVQYYFAGDGHNHWHVRDFDSYQLLNASGTEVARAEKHGYCMYDNNGPWRSGAGFPTTPVYTADTSCGRGLPNALTIVHGLSQGWGDAYFSYLPDQAIDITGVPDGTYTVRVEADTAGAVKESNENNNAATIKVQISGDNVTVVPGSSHGA